MAVRTATIALTFACVAGSAIGQYDGGACSANQDQPGDDNCRSMRAPVLLQTKAVVDVLQNDLSSAARAGFGTAVGTELDVGAFTMRNATADEKQAFLDWTNSYRCMHGVDPVAWSDAVAANAAVYIGPMTTMVHSQSYSLSPPAGPAGENLYWASAVQTSAELGTAAGAVKAWYREVNSCVGGPTGFTDGCVNGTNGTTGHFTAMIWKGVKTIGCAFSNSVKPIVILCRYKAGDTLSLDTPNMNKATGNYKLHVFPANKTLAQCTTGGAATTSTGAPAAPTSTPAPTGAPTPAP